MECGGLEDTLFRQRCLKLSSNPVDLATITFAPPWFDIRCLHGITLDVYGPQVFLIPESGDTLLGSYELQVYRVHFLAAYCAGDNGFHHLLCDFDNDGLIDASISFNGDGEAPVLRQVRLVDMAGWRIIQGFDWGVTYISEPIISFMVPRDYAVEKRPESIKTRNFIDMSFWVKNLSSKYLKKIHRQSKFTCQKNGIPAMERLRMRNQADENEDQHRKDEHVVHEKPEMPRNKKQDQDEVPEKPFTPRGPSHRPPSKKKKSKSKVHQPNKERSIVEAQMHADKLKHDEEQRVAELIKRAELVNIGRYIQNGT